MPLQPARPVSSNRDRLLFRPRVGPSGDVLVVIFLRGGMDGLYTVPPFGDPNFAALRNSMGSVEPARGGLRKVVPSYDAVASGLIDLDGYFGLHPLFAPLESLFRQKQLAIVQAAGLSVPILSHFEATDAIEQGLVGPGAHDGWIARHLNVDVQSNVSPLRAIAMDLTLPMALRGTTAHAVDSLADFRLETPGGWDPQFFHSLRALYQGGSDLVSTSGRATLATYTTVQRLAKSPSKPENGAEYPVDQFGSRLTQVAQIIKAEIGLEAAVIGLGDWDSHVGQVDMLAGPMQSLAEGMQNLVRDLGDRMRRVTVLVMSEFGRRAAPNEGGGTDHGRGTAMFVVGGGIRGGKVYGQWPGLGADQLDDQGNLRVTTDYRAVLAEIVEKRLNNGAIDRVFPGFVPRYLNLTA